MQGTEEKLFLKKFRNFPDFPGLRRMWEESSSFEVQAHFRMDPSIKRVG
jgi:hypothetical protein